MAKSGSSVVWIIILLIVAGGAGGGYYYWKKGSDKPPEVATTTATRGEIIQVVTSTGDLQPVLTTDVSSQISGQIKEVLVDFNSTVKKGDVLARIDPATYDSRLKQAEAQLMNTKANYTLVKLNFERSKQLFERNLVSQQDLDQAEATFQQSTAQLQIQAAAVENAKVDLSRCTLYAPIDGVVIDRLAEVGKTVSASTSAPTLFTLVNDLGRMQIKAAVAEADIGNIAVDQDVQFTVDAFPGRQFRGRVSQIRNSPVVAQNVVTYSTIVEVRNEDMKLKPGMTANVSIVIARRTGVVKVRNAALRARIAEQFLPAAPAAKAAAPAAGSPAAKAEGGAPKAAAGAGGNNREQMRALMAEVGVNMRDGPPSAEQLTKLRALAAERGIELPERMLGGAGGGRAAGGAAAVVTRTLYKLAGTETAPAVTPVSAKLGISDGIDTEVLEGIDEGDIIVTSINVPGAPAAAAGARPAASPFGGGGGGMRR